MNFTKNMQVLIDLENRTIFDDTVVEKLVTNEIIVRLLTKNSCYLEIKDEMFKGGSVLLDATLETYGFQSDGSLDLTITVELF